jgi:thiol-disulfide isomerase/thioredoxin
MFNRSTCLSFIVLIAGAVFASDVDPRVDYGLFAAVTPIGNSSTDLRPAKGETLLLQFWASWCHSCGTIMWDMDELVSQNPGMKYIAVSLDDETSDARNYIRKHKLFEKYSDRYYIDADKQFSKSLGIDSVPSILLVDENGKILVKKSGHLNSADLLKFVSAFRAAH